MIDYNIKAGTLPSYIQSAVLQVYISALIITFNKFRIKSPKCIKKDHTENFPEQDEEAAHAVDQDIRRPKGVPGLGEAHADLRCSCSAMPRFLRGDYRLFSILCQSDFGPDAPLGSRSPAAACIL